MSCLLLTCFLIMVGSGIVAWRRRVARFYLTFAVAGGAGLVFGLARFGIGANVAYPTDVGALLLAFLVSVSAFGLPRPIARRLGWGLRSREWEFDRQLHRLVEAFDDLQREYPGPDDQAQAWRWARRVLARGAPIGFQIRSLRPPDRAWAELAQGYGRLIDDTLESMRRGEAGPVDALQRQRDELKERQVRLRELYRQRTEEILSRGLFHR